MADYPTMVRDIHKAASDDAFADFQETASLFLKLGIPNPAAGANGLFWLIYIR